MAELAYAPDLGSGPHKADGGSTPPFRILFSGLMEKILEFGSKFSILYAGRASVAQLVELHVANVMVVGSNPIARSNFLF